MLCIKSCFKLLSNGEACRKYLSNGATCRKYLTYIISIKVVNIGIKILLSMFLPLLYPYITDISSSLNCLNHFNIKLRLLKCKISVFRVTQLSRKFYHYYKYLYYLLCFNLLYFLLTNLMMPQEQPC